MHRALLASCAVAALAACSHAVHPVQAIMPTAKPGEALFVGGSPAKIVVQGKPYDLAPDGQARYAVLASFADRDDHQVVLASGGNVDFIPSHGTAQWQTRLRFGGPSAIISTTTAGPLQVRVHAAVGPPLADAGLATDSSLWNLPPIAARALGPRAVWLGWFPRETTGTVTIVRTAPSGKRTTFVVPAPSSTYRDEAVRGSSVYRYDVTLSNGRQMSFQVTTPAEARGGSLAAARGKGMWLSFSPSANDADGYDKIDAAADVARAVEAGIRSIDIRTAYGPFWEISADARAAIDALIDGAAAHGIASIAWVVPRSTNFDDLLAAVASTQYRSAGGHAFSALAIDLERGDYFMGSGATGRAAIATYLRRLRAALGPRYPIIATIEDPNLERLTEADYPYAEIAADADALEPMAYWRLLDAKGSGAGITGEIDASYRATLRAAGRNVPVDIGLQSATFAGVAPDPAALSAAVAAARKDGALGVTFFDWSGTSPEAWRAIGDAPYAP